MTEKKKIGIVTITNDGYNFGNRLQNYALQTVLERLGFKVETLNRPIRGNQRLWWLNVKMVLHYLLPYKRQIEHVKAKNFFFWNNKYIKWSKLVAIDENLSSLALKYDYFIAGSDQIWNPKFIWGKDSYMYLQFASPKQRIAYAPSIGVDTLNESDYQLYHQYWANWKALSAREFEGAKLISDITNTNIPTLIDPTFLLSQKEWSRLTDGIKVPHKYIVVYMLGNITGEYKEYLDKLALIENCEIIDVMTDARYAICNPSKFVALIQHAERVVADSYHAMVFAMIFHRDITFVDRVGWGMNMNSRVKTLLGLFDISVNELQSITEIDIDWETFERLLEKERQKSVAYLQNVLR